MKKLEPQKTEEDIVEELVQHSINEFDVKADYACFYLNILKFEIKQALHSYAAQREQTVREGCNRQKLELEKEISEDIRLMKLPYSYKIKSPFSSEGVDYHLKTYGHLPSAGCCRYDQYSDEETDIYNKAIDDISEALKTTTPNDTVKL